MTYYIGLLLKNNTIIAADRRITEHWGSITKTRDDFGKIGKISQYSYFSGAGDMGACAEICSYLKNMGLQHPEEIQQIGGMEILEIYNKKMKLARTQIPDFDRDKELKGYLNLSMIVGGISKTREPIMYVLNNLSHFLPVVIKRQGCGTATNMGMIANTMTKHFFDQLTKDIGLMNAQPVCVIEILKLLFGNISRIDGSVSPVFDVMMVDNDGRDTLQRHSGPISQDSKHGVWKAEWKYETP